MNRYKKLLGNTVIFAIGNFGSRFINFFLVPLQTYYLTTTEFGKIDLLFTIISLFIPIVSLNISDATLRFIKDDYTKRFSIYYNGLFVITVMTSIFILPLFIWFILQSNYLWSLVILLMALQIFQIQLDQYTRSVDKIKNFAANGIIMSVVILIFNLVLLIKFKLGIYGVILSIVFANMVSIVYLYFVNKDLRKNKVSIKNIVSRKLILEMFKYSIPLTPNMIMWWLINGSTRFFIVYYLGATFNGLFAVANKIPSLLTMITSIFAQAWQLSSMEEVSSSDNSLYYSKTFNFYSSILFIVSSGIIVFTKFLVYILVSQDYYASWQLVPVLLIASLYSSLSGFVGSVYTASMNTKGVLISSIFGAFLTLSSNLLLIPLLGISGAGIGTLLSFLGMFVLRLKDTKRYIKIDINLKIFLLNNVIVLLQWLVLCIFKNNIIMYFSEFILFLFIMLNNKKYVLLIFDNLRKRYIVK
ncbi:hypothetical protein CBF34_02755 [Vagococcus penaei]|uniref:Uncharacterized protein n=1 Tax=Vagococcus penaei TaxID=633807 RepID=A0A1Q2D3Z0_9ENTE|nr:oligosaccharide flippase family protein [Vagococcus penaei]AQP53088.1 hypothetical protein BW732_01830 [Vagococcus penaei]RSU06049.1 hypothetical protein CBF34_02755 [Vagococcus penaei]